MSEEELKVYFAIFNECWKFFKQHFSMNESIVGSDEYWNNVIDDLDKRISLYPNNKFASKMLIQTMDEIERIIKGKG